MKVEPRTDVMHAITALTGVILTWLPISSLWLNRRVLGYQTRGSGSSPHEGIRVFYAAKRRRTSSKWFVIFNTCLYTCVIHVSNIIHVQKQNYENDYHCLYFHIFLSECDEYTDVYTEVNSAINR